MDLNICEGKSCQTGPDTLSTEQKKKFKRVKNLINVGEVSKAMSALLSNGVAKVDKEVLNQLKNKHPSRPAVIRLPSQEQIMAERGTIQIIRPTVM